MQNIKGYIFGGAGLLLLWIVSQMYIAKQNANIEKQNAKIIEWQSKNPKIVWKKEYIKTASSVVTIKAGADAVTKINPDGSVEVKGTAEVSGKTETTEGGKEEEKKEPVYTTQKKDDIIFLGGAIETTGLFGVCGSYKLFNEVLITGTVLQKFPLQEVKGIINIQIPLRIP